MSSKGWQRLSYGPDQDPRTTCISTNLRRAGYDLGWHSGVRDIGDATMEGRVGSKSRGIPRDFPVNTIVQDPQRPDYVYVGTKQVVLHVA